MGDDRVPAPRIRYVVLDVADLDRAAAFWTRLLGVSVAGRDERYVWLEPCGPGPSLVLQLVGEPKHGKNRAHFDLVMPDPAAALRLVPELGGRVVEHVVEPAYSLWVLADPEGNEFCIEEHGSGMATMPT